jgi:putative CocE/NonD family hydrolase
VRIAFLVLTAAIALRAAPPSIEERLHVRVPMRDGVPLCTNIFRPAGSERRPTILVRTPYNKGGGMTPNYRAFVERGYAVVVQDVRGRYHSDGVFEPFAQETPDGSDTLNWIAGQPWSNGKVGMIGGSYVGIVQWKAALSGNPHLKAIFPVVSGDDDYRDRYYSTGGALKLGQRLYWMSENLRAPGFAKPDFNRFIWRLPLRMADRAATGQRSAMLQKALDHPSRDAFWKSVSSRERIHEIRVPVFAVGGWYDNFVEGDLDAFVLLRKLGRPNRLIVGPWPHDISYKLPGVDYGMDSQIPLRKLQLEWFDYWLKGSAAPPSSAPLRYFVMGANQWREADVWPPKEVRSVPLYLASNGHANTASGDGALRSRAPSSRAADVFVYDPMKPVPTTGGAVCCNARVFAWGPLDQRNVERRRDVLVYTSRPLQRPLRIAGPVRVVLHVATSATDTDFTAKLVDVSPDGRAVNLTDGILRLRYRASVEKPVLAKPGEIYRIEIEAGPTSALFHKGHLVRLEISSSNFPRFARNPNTGRSIAEEHEVRTARQTVYHDRKHPSHLLLPVME